MTVCLLTAVVALPLGYLFVSWSISAYSFLSLYRPEKLFQESSDPPVPSAKNGAGILDALNAEIEEENCVKQREEGWLLARVDRLWRSVRKYVSPATDTGSHVPAKPLPPLAGLSPTSQPLTEQAHPTVSLATNQTAQPRHDALALVTHSEGFDSNATLHDPLQAISQKSMDAIEAHGAEKTIESLYRFQSLKGLRTESVIYQINRRLALEGTIEATPGGETDPDLSDFGFRTVHALNFLENRPTPAITMAYEAVHSGYPLSYGIGLNYQVSPLVTVRFDYSYETPNDTLVEYNGTWESSLMNNYDKKRADNSLSVHSFFLGLRYLYQQKATRIPLHTGFFYSTNMDNDPLTSNVSLGFSIGGGINRRDLSLGLAWRFRIWNNPDAHFPNEQDMQQLETKIANQFLFTLLF